MCVSAAGRYTLWQRTRLQLIVTDAGAHPGTERDVDWIDPSTSLDLRETIDRKIGGAFPYELHLDVRFLSGR